MLRSSRVKHILAIHLKALHIAMMLYVNVGVFLSDSRYVLYSIIFLQALMLTQWYLFGGCVFTPLENFLNDKNKAEKFESGLEVGFTSKLFQKVFGLSLDTTFKVTSLIPILMVTIALYRLESLCQR